jgi:hypothetical protein
VDVGVGTRASDIRLSCVVTYWFVAPGVPLEPASAFFWPGVGSVTSSSAPPDSWRVL